MRLCLFLQCLNVTVPLVEDEQVPAYVRKAWTIRPTPVNGQLALNETESLQEH